MVYAGKPFNLASQNGLNVERFYDRRPEPHARA